MWFKNLRAYRLTQPFAIEASQLDEQLAAQRFCPCAPSQSLSLGWTSPLGDQDDAPLVHSASGRLLLRMRREEKLLPASVVREQLDERIEAIELAQGRKVYRKERLSLKDEVVQDCLPRAFSRSSHVTAYIDPAAGWIMVDAASANRAEELLNLLRESIGTFPVLLPQVIDAPLATMTHWLVHDSLPEDFTATGECELREPGDEGGVVRVRGVDLFSEEVQTHLNAGRQVVRMALDWDERVTFVLAEDLCLRRLKFADALLSENDDLPEDDALARLDADFVLMSEAIAELYALVIQRFGGLAEG
jgi:recombination associated protein RdgC